MRRWRRRSKKRRRKKRREQNEEEDLVQVSRAIPISLFPLRGLIPGGGRRWEESVEDWWSAALMGDYTC